MQTLNTLLSIYLCGAGITIVVAFFLSRAPELRIRLLASRLTELTWPLSFPVALFFSLF